MKQTIRSDTVCSGDSKDKKDKGVEIREVNVASKRIEIDVRYGGEK